MGSFFSDIYASGSEFLTKYYQVIIENGNWRYLTSGLAVTLRTTFFSLLLGIGIGIFVAVVRSSWDQLSEPASRRPGFPFALLRFCLRAVDIICRIYLTIIRGTPVMIQIMVAFLVIFVSMDKGVSAVITFGINSGAYVSEIIRGGIMSIDKGQTEAGRSLGFGFVPTMWFIVLPQAFKNILPSLANEFIVLLKETAIIGVIGGSDLVRAAQIIVSRTYTAAIPLLTIAVMYLVMVMFFTWLVGILERRLRQSDH